MMGGFLNRPFARRRTSTTKLGTTNNSRFHILTRALFDREMGRPKLQRSIVHLVSDLGNWMGPILSGVFSPLKPISLSSDLDDFAERYFSGSKHKCPKSLWLLMNVLTVTSRDNKRSTATKKIAMPTSTDLRDFLTIRCWKKKQYLALSDYKASQDDGGI